VKAVFRHQYSGRREAGDRKSSRGTRRASRRVELVQLHAALFGPSAIHGDEFLGEGMGVRAAVAGSDDEMGVLRLARVEGDQSLPDQVEPLCQ
jgi:hypothetical protein